MSNEPKCQEMALYLCGSFKTTIKLQKNHLMIAVPIKYQIIAIHFRLDDKMQ